MTNIKFTLLENAKDSLERAIEHMQPIYENGQSDISTGAWKTIIVNLAHVVELLFKEKLQRIDPAFIYTDLDKYSPNDSSNDFPTISAENAFKRLVHFGNILFTDAEKSAIKTARTNRNKIEHFGFSITKEIAKPLTGEIIDFIFRFSKEHLELDWNEELKQSYWSLIHEDIGFYEKKLKKVAKKIDADKLEVIVCSRCYNRTFNTAEKTCLLCDYEEDLLSCSQCGHLYFASPLGTLCSECSNPWGKTYCAG